MCILHNLSYRLDAEVPTRYRQLEYGARNAYTEKSSTGCFSNKSDKMMVSTDPEPGPAPPRHPAGLSGLAHPFPPVPPPPPSPTLKPETSPRGQAQAKAPASGRCRTLGAESRAFCLAYRGGLCSSDHPEVKSSSPPLAELVLSNYVIDKLGPIFSITLEGLGVTRTLSPLWPGSHQLPSLPGPPRSRRVLWREGQASRAG